MKQKNKQKGLRLNFSKDLTEAKIDRSEEYLECYGGIMCPHLYYDDSGFAICAAIDDHRPWVCPEERFVQMDPPGIQNMTQVERIKWGYYKPHA